MALKVIAWSTGNVGKHALAGIDAHPDLELIGVYVSNPDKAGKDAGRLAGLDRDFGVLASNDAEALLAMKPDCIVHTAWVDDRLFEGLGDLARFLKAGINVVSSGPVFLQYPYGIADDLAKGVIEAGREGGASIFVNGIDPGFGNDTLPLMITGISERIEEVRAFEICNYATYNQAAVLFDIMGFGKPMDEVPFLLQPGVPTLAWGSVIGILAAGLGLELERIEEWYERVPAPFPIHTDAGPVAEGTVAGLHFELRGYVDGKAVVVLEHVTRLHDDIAPEWPQPAGASCYRVQVTGEPNYLVDLQLLGTDGDHNTAGLKATAMRLVNAVPAVVAASPGLVTALDLPLITGKGLVRTT
jgi:4-hydroxy-tetrahydrodipicolinate reductase